MIYRDRQLELALRQRELLLISSQQRIALMQQVQMLRPPLQLADRVHDGWRWLRSHPEVPLAAAALLLLLRPLRALRWAGKLWWGWRTWRRVQRMVAGLR